MLSSFYIDTTAKRRLKIIRTTLNSTQKRVLTLVAIPPLGRITGLISFSFSMYIDHHVKWNTAKVIRSNLDGQLVLNNNIIDGKSQGLFRGFDFDRFAYLGGGDKYTNIPGNNIKLYIMSYEFYMINFIQLILVAYQIWL